MTVWVCSLESFNITLKEKATQTKFLEYQEAKVSFPLLAFWTNEYLHGTVGMTYLELLLFYNIMTFPQC